MTRVFRTPLVDFRAEHNLHYFHRPSRTYPSNFIEDILFILSNVKKDGALIDCLEEDLALVP
jgi:hypothetical protein